MDGAPFRSEAETEFDLFYLRSEGALLRQMILLTGDPAEAEDAVQEAFERAWLRWQTVRLCESPEAWVRTVARRLAVSTCRRRRNAMIAWRQRVEPAVGADIDSDHLVLMAALRTLPQAQRAAIVLHHLADLPVAQVAAETGASVSAVKQQLVRGRAGLAAVLANDVLEARGRRAGDRKEER